MKAAQEAAKAAKAPAKEKKIIFFNIQESVSSTTGAFFMLIIFCNGKERSKLIIPFLVLEHQYLNTKHDSSCCPLYLFLSTLFGYIKKDATPSGLSKIYSQSRFSKNQSNYSN
jgi:hypothetical protein